MNVFFVRETQNALLSQNIVLKTAYSVCIALLSDSDSDQVRFWVHVALSEKCMYKIE